MTAEAALRTARSLDDRPIMHLHLSSPLIQLVHMFPNLLFHLLLCLMIGQLCILALIIVHPLVVHITYIIYIISDLLMAVIATANADLTATCGYEVTTSGMRLLKADSGQNSHVE